MKYLKLKENYNDRVNGGDMYISFGQAIAKPNRIVILEGINAEKIAVTGKKLEQKMYYHHSDYVGGMKEVTLKEKLEKKPETVIELAVKGMLPKGPLGREMYTKLHVYVGPDHKHAAQKPEVLTF